MLFMHSEMELITMEWNPAQLFRPYSDYLWFGAIVHSSGFLRCVLFSCMHLCVHTTFRYLWRPKRGIRSLRPGVICSCELMTNLGPLQEQQLPSLFLLPHCSFWRLWDFPDYRLAIKWTRVLYDLVNIKC